MTRSFRVLSTFVGLFAFGIAVADGVHEGSNNPANEGWTLDASGGIEGPIFSDSDFPSVSSWEIHAIAGFRLYEMPGAGAETDWTLRGRVRVVDLADAADLGIALHVSDSADRRWLLTFGTDADGNTLIIPEAAGVTLTVPAEQAGRSDYVLVEMAAADGLMDLFVNGVEMVSDVPHLPASRTDRVIFGDGSSADAGRGRYALVEFTTGPQACRDGIDNDGDGFVDFAGGDADCSQPNDPSEGGAVSQAVSVGALTYNPALNDEVIFDSRNNREWLRWNELLSGGGFLSYAEVVDAITTGAYSGQGWTIGRNADGLAFVDAALDGQSHSCGVTGNFNNCGIPAGDFNAVVGDNCTANETVAFLLSDNGEGSEAGVLDLVSDVDRLLFYNEWGSIAQTDLFTCGGFGGSWLIYRDGEVPPDGLVGSWHFVEETVPGSAGGPVVVTLLANGQYLIAQDGDPMSDPNGEDGMEWGTYVLDEVNSTLSFTAQLDTNGEWGADGATLPFVLNGNQLVVGVEGDSITLQRVYSNSLPGAWLFDGARDDESVVVNFLVDGTFMLVHGNNPGDDCGCGQAGIEYGTYSWDPSSGALALNIVTDTNGEFGLSDPNGAQTLSVNGNVLTASDDEGSVTLTRISAMDNDGDGAADLHDNCTAALNASQLDTDDDGIGNACDADFNQDCSVNFVDLGEMKSVFFQAGALDEDMNGDGSVNFVDLGLLKQAFFAPPGPSGIPNVCLEF
ncbi:MAG: hypothetical protein AAFN78_12840 [Pseudomonadota bacterium]